MPATSKRALLETQNTTATGNIIWTSCNKNNEIIRLPSPKILITEDEFQLYVYDNVVYVSNEQLKKRLFDKSVETLKSIGINADVTFNLKYEWQRGKFEITSLPVYNGVYNAKLAYRCDFITRNIETGTITVKWQLVQVVPRIINYFD